MGENILVPAVLSFKLKLLLRLKIDSYLCANRVPLLEMELGCSHPTVMNDLCAECGADLRKEDVVSAQASVPMVHSVPDLKVSEEVILKILLESLQYLSY